MYFRIKKVEKVRLFSLLTLRDLLGDVIYFPVGAFANFFDRLLTGILYPGNKPGEFQGERSDKPYIRLKIVLFMRHASCVLARTLSPLCNTN